MSLLTDLAKCLDRTRSECIERVFYPYVVGDLTAEDAKTILLLESPDADEIAARHPLAGNAGKGVTAALKSNSSARPHLPEGSANSDSNEAFGCILKRCSQTLDLGLMNCSLLPLQINAYFDDSWQRWQSHANFLCFLQTVRNRLSKSAPEEAQGIACCVERVLRDDLRSRLEDLPNGALVVPCGDIARRFVEGYEGSAHIYSCNVPHPARGQWQNGKNHEVIERLLNKISARASQ